MCEFFEPITDHIVMNLMKYYISLPRLVLTPKHHLLRRVRIYYFFQADMGAKLAKRKEAKESLGNSLGELTKDPKKRYRPIQNETSDDDCLVESNSDGGSDASTKAKKRLKELQVESPPGFRKFESEVEWQRIDAEIALQLWEDVFKPMYTFY